MTALKYKEQYHLLSTCHVTALYWPLYLVKLYLIFNILFFIGAGLDLRIYIEFMNDKVICKARLLCYLRPSFGCLCFYIVCWRKEGIFILPCFTVSIIHYHLNDGLCLSELYFSFAFLSTDPFFRFCQTLECWGWKEYQKYLCFQNVFCRSLGSQMASLKMFHGPNKENILTLFNLIDSEITWLHSSFIRKQWFTLEA